MFCECFRIRHETPEERIGQNVVDIIIKMKTIIQIHLLIKIIKLHMTCLVYLFNGILTFGGYLMLKPYL